jgi:hypothetical protein
MLSLPTLNRRHKAGLFLVLVVAGLSLLFEASAKQTVGIVLLGLAATWFFGSVAPRTLGFILASAACCVGLYLVIAPVWEERELYHARNKAYDQALLDIREAIAKAPVWQVVPPPIDFSQPALAHSKKAAKPVTPQKGQYSSAEIDHGSRVVDIPASAITFLRPAELDAYTVSFPAEMPAEEVLRAFQTSMVRPTFSLRGAIYSHLLSSVPGSLLFLLGLLGLIISAWHRFKTKQQVAVPQQPSA